MTATVAVSFNLRAAERAVLAEALGSAATPVFLPDLDPSARLDAVRTADAILARHTGKELSAEERAALGGCRLVQFMTAGVDYVPLKELPPHVAIASNGGAYAEPMAEHAVAMMLAAAKRLLVEHAALEQGVFNQFTPNRMLSGATCGILGFGGIGQATARRLRAFGMRIHAINRSGRTDEPVDWIGTIAEMDTLLGAADVLLISLPLTPATSGMIGPRELGLMKPDAMLVNLARGEVVQEAALFAHLQAHPEFFACIDAWWVEPVRHGAFRMDHPFTSLPNVVGSPHNSGSAKGVLEGALQRAAANIRRVLAGEAARFLVGAGDRMM